MRKISKEIKVRRFVLGDLHGNYKGLVQVLEKVCFNDEIDCLYFVGDLADGPQNVECLKRLMKIKNLFPCWGNHDIRLRDYLDGTIFDGKLLVGAVPFSNLEDMNRK